MSIVGTGVTLTKDEMNELRSAASVPLIVVAGHMPETLEEVLYRIALRKGLPEIPGYYGLDQDKTPPEITYWVEDAPVADAPVADVARFLFSVLGSRLASMILDLKDPKALLNMAEGDRPASTVEEQRARAAHPVVAVLREGGLPPAGIQSWMCGMNPDLDDGCPAELLQTGDPAKAEAVLHAARAHAS